MLASELATRLGVAESTVSRLLSGERRPSLDMVLKIRATLLWGLEAQSAALQKGNYGTLLRVKMEAAR